MLVNRLVNEGKLKKLINEFKFKETITLDFSSNKHVFLKCVDEAKKDFESIVDSNYRSPNCSEEYYTFWNELALLVKKWFGNGS